MTATRRLAAILAADVAGYSRLMGVDEEGTHERLKAHLRQLVNPKIKEHRGRIVKNTRDGMLAEFSSVADAVRCAAELQRAMVDRDTDMAEDRRIKFRVGINLGDIIVDDGDIYGDGVNVAARLWVRGQAACRPLGGLHPHHEPFSRRGQILRFSLRAANFVDILRKPPENREANQAFVSRFPSGARRELLAARQGNKSAHQGNKSANQGK
jgi:hypothetical protein